MAKSSKAVVESSKTLVIVESPSKAHKIQEYLGPDYIVMASKGHIADLAKGGKHGLGIDVNNNFKPHYVLNDDKIDLVNSLIKTAKICDKILLMSDPDREGEAISYHLYKRLEDCEKPMHRVVINEIKKDKILKAIKEFRDIDMNLFLSQQNRRILDRLVGFMASPFLMNCVAPKLSAGRVQSVVTRMIIDREREIESFIPETYYTIQVSLSNDKKTSFKTQYSKKLVQENEAKKIAIKLNNNPYIVSEVNADEEKVYPIPPMITSTLQRIMSKKHGFDAARTMKAAQSLYEGGYCTYIRTDSVRASDESIEELREYLKSNKFEIPKKPYNYKNSDDAQDAHECIRPSDLFFEPKTQNLLEGDEQKVYEVIWNYFVANQMMPAVYNTLKIIAHVKNDKSAEVKTSGKALKTAGFLDMLGEIDNSKIEIPNLSKNDELYLFGQSPIKIEKKQTKPPPRFSEDKLIKELVSKNIGRPATYADLLSKITNRNYVEKKGNVYHATDLGKQVTDILTKYFTFMDYNYTAKMELQLDLVERGKLNNLDMLNTFYPEFKAQLDNAYIDNDKKMCEKCGSPMVLRTAKSSGEKFWGCSGFSKGCKFTKKFSI